ncbi:MAG TPA: pectate lyase [Rhodocyclaceae bacterium]|nr:pectate lyase [Rhodocyclaceae bacterium]
MLRHSLLIALVAAALSSPAFSQTPPAVPAPPSGTSPSRSDGSLKTVALIMGEPNYSIDGAYQELEEGFYTQPELLAGERMFAPINEILLNLGGEAVLDAEQQSARFALAGRSLVLKAGQLDGELNGKSVRSDVAPEWRNGNLWVPVFWVFDQLGAYSKWDKARQRYSAAFVLPNSKKSAGLAKGGPVTEANLTDQKPAFWATPDGIKVAEVVLGYQNADGGWPKVERDVSLSTPINRSALSGFKAKSTIDNDSTTKQIIVLARAYKASGQERFREGVDKGLEYLLAAQLPNGGWQQYWPDPQGYKARITFNDDAIANVLDILGDVAAARGDFSFVSTSQVQRAGAAYDTGLAMILKTQLVVQGKKTGWCAQYDEKTLLPAMGRAFELASISGGESVNVVRFLMRIEKPSREVIQAVQSAIAWLDSAKLTGVKRARREDRTLEYGFDFVLETDPAAGPLWARFYDPVSGKPLFSSRDSAPRSSFDQVAYERRVKYNWYTTEAADLLSHDYPEWVKRLHLQPVKGTHSNAS